jgi:hypothetical protein
MATNLLIHSMAEFSCLTLPILTAINAKTIAEVGAEHGGNSKLLYDWLAPRQGQLISIDPAPSEKFLSWQSHVNNIVTHIAKPSLDAIENVGAVDAWFIDGDHNWYTVYHELLAINKVTQQQPLLIFLHDVGWPAARRDLYYAPDRIPEKYLLPHTWDLGITPDSKDLIPGGFRGEKKFAIALREGGARNGVLTAIEDFVALAPDNYYWAAIPAVFGLGVLFNCEHPQARTIASILAPFNENSLLATLEKNRLANYLTVIEWQDRVKQAMPTVDQTVETEKTIMQLIDILSDNKNHPEIWSIFENEGKLSDKGDLPRFAEQLKDLLLLPQRPEIKKILTLLQCLCIANNDELVLALTTLEDLLVSYPACPLLTGAILHMVKRINPNDARLSQVTQQETESSS